MGESWNEGVRGTQVPALINTDATTIRCVTGRQEASTGRTSECRRSSETSWVFCRPPYRAPPGAGACPH